MEIPSMENGACVMRVIKGVACHHDGFQMKAFRYQKKSFVILALLYLADHSLQAGQG
jgi:hypothetical protein